MTAHPATRLPRLRALAVALALAGTLAACGGDSPEKLLASARASIEKKDWKAAEIHLKNLLQKQDGAEARLLLGDVARAGNDLRTAEKEYRRALELGAAPDAVGPKLLQAMLAIGEARKVVEQARNLALTTPAAQAEAATTVARAWAAQGNVAETRKGFEAALAIDANHVPARVGLIGLQAGAGDREGAAAALDALLETSPDSVDALLMRADLALLAGQLAQGRSRVEKAVALAPTNPAVRAKMAAILIDLKDYAGARKEVAALEGLIGASPGAMQLKALVEFREGKLEAARDAVLLALKSAPDYLPANTLAANVFLGLGNLEQAERYARVVVEKVPNGIVGYRLLAATYLRMNAPDRALATVQPLIDRKVDDPVLLSLAGEAAMKLNDTARAAQYLERAARLDPNDPAKRTALAAARFAGGNKDAGFADLEAAARLDGPTHQAEVALVMALARDRQFDKALAAIDKLAPKMKDSPTPPNLRGMVLLAKNDLAGARAAWTEANRVDPKFYPAVANLASLDVRDGKPAEARKRFETLAATDPKNPQPWLAIATLNVNSKGPKDETLKALRKAREASPTAITPVTALAAFHLSENTPREAITLLQEGLTANPENLDLLGLLAVAYARSDDKAQAAATYDRILRAAPSSAEAHFRVGQAREQLGDDNGALAAFRKASELQPKAVEPRFAIASVLLKQGKKEEARQIAATMKRDLPQSPAGLALEGDLALIDGRPADAVGPYRAALEKTRSPELGIKLHNALARAGRTAEADAFVAQWLKTSPKDLTMRMLAGESEIGRKRWKEAVEHYRVVLEASPKQPIALNNSAWALHQLRDPKAREVAEQAFAVAPKAAPVVDTLGVILAAGADPARGTELLREAIKLDPKNPQYRLHLAQALARGGDKAGARSEIETILKEFGSSPMAGEAKALLAGL